MKRTTDLSTLVAICAVVGAPMTARADLPVIPAAQVDAVFADLDHTNTPGCALIVIRDGKQLYRRGYGMADIELGVAISPQSVIDIGSLAKQFTAMSVLMLAEEGKLSLDDDVRKYVPELPKYGRPITVRHLMHHTSGLRDYITLLLIAGRDFSDIVTDEEAFGLLMRQQALDFPTGEKHSYSNSGYFLLGLILKRVSGESLTQFMQRRIFTPLGMSHTEMHNDAHVTLIENRATGYSPDGDFAASSPREDGSVHPQIWRFLQTGDGGIFSTVEDLLRWDENFYTAQVGGAAVLEQMHVTGVLNDGKPITYAGGLLVERYRGLRRVMHTGGGAGFSSAIVRFPDQHFSTLVSCNMNGAGSGTRAQKVADLYLAQTYSSSEIPKAEDEPPVPASHPSSRLTSAQLASYAGDYWSEELGIEYRVRGSDGTLKLHIGDRMTRPLAPVKADSFAVQDLLGGYVVVEFKRRGSGKAAGLTVGAGPIHDLEFKRVR